MAQTMNYANILTHVLREEAQIQPSIQPITIAPVCDPVSGQFLLIATGYENKAWFDSILFHARLADGLVVIELDNIEEGLKPALIEAGIPAEHIISGLKFAQRKAEPAAA
jgi:hypothetical protein